MQTARRLGKTIGISPGSRSLLRQWKSVKASLFTFLAGLPCRH